MPACLLKAIAPYIHSFLRELETVVEVLQRRSGLINFRSDPLLALSPSHRKIVDSESDRFCPSTLEIAFVILVAILEV
jgi:hypothetical protein